MSTDIDQKQTNIAETVAREVKQQRIGSTFTLPDGNLAILTENGLVEFDHCPAIQLRSWDPEKQDTVPPANALDHIIARNKTGHRTKTSGGKATSLGSDIHAIAKIKRLTGETKKGKKAKTKWPSRPIQSRGFIK